ncbi:AMP-binding protein [Azospirillum sp. RWY-5-1]|uniref:AMP-binding protein n=1 Tax=Azospirillum oleiclasticum TaxID=2735135 RepID=A0ABX2TJF6_9PROT|nr:AMP-binding protein [Azospirillum oleiclasticum]NYZ14410.1 AMP-binding protein [Azospirillum oleiclasticum]NYZ23238.1 AMP-binding protein [Azospirillum oleiclasticum]
MTSLPPQGAPPGADTLPKLIAHHARTRPTRPAMRHKRRGIWRTWTWAGQATDVAAIARVLAEAGVATDAVVATLGDNRPELYHAMLAAQCLGATALPIPATADADRLAAVLAGHVPAVVVAETEEQADTVQRVARRAEPVVLRLAAPGASASSIPTLEERAARFRDTPADWFAAKAAATRADAVAVVLHSAGIQGKPRPVPLSHADLLSAASTGAAALALTPEDLALAFLPMDSVLDQGMLVVPALVAGHCVACAESPATIATDLHDLAPTVIVAPPRAFELIDRRIRRHLPVDRPLVRIASALGAAGRRLLLSAPLLNALGLRRLRVAVSVGDALGPGCAVRLRALGVPLRQGYGLAEAAGLVALERDEGGTMQPLPGVSVTTVDGQLRVRRDDGRWIDTGDAASLTPDGGMTLLGRRDARLAVGGHPLDPAAVEADLRGHDAIDRAFVQGDGSGRLAALLVLDPDTVGRWAHRQGIALAGGMTTGPVRDLAARLVEATNAALHSRHGADAIARFDIATGRIDAALTPTGRLRRHLLARAVPRGREA